MIHFYRTHFFLFWDWNKIRQHLWLMDLLCSKNNSHKTIQVFWYKTFVQNWAKNHFNTITFVKSWSYEQFFCLKPKSLLMSQFSNPKFFLVQFKCADVSKEEVWWEYKTNGALFLQSKTNVNARIFEPKPLKKVV